MNYGLPDTTVEKINAVFKSFPEVEQAVLYGSRAKGNYKPGSDIDLTLHGSALTTFLFNEIVSKLDDLLLPYKIDLSIFAALKHSELEAHVKRVGIVLCQRSDAMTRR